MACRAGGKDTMQALDRDLFGLDMLPEVDMSETADEDDTPTGDLHVLPPRCLHRVAQPGSIDHGSLLRES